MSCNLFCYDMFVDKQSSYITSLYLYWDPQSPYSHGDCRELRKVFRPSIAMLASLDLLGDQLISKDREKLLLICNTKMQKLMYKFGCFTYPTLRQNICKYKQMDMSGVIDGVCKL